MNTSRTFQKFLGFGNAITDAAAIGFNKIHPPYRNRFSSNTGAHPRLNFLSEGPNRVTDFPRTFTRTMTFPETRPSSLFDRRRQEHERNGQQAGLLKSVLAKVKDTAMISIFASWAPPADD